MCNQTCNNFILDNKKLIFEYVLSFLRKIEVSSLREIRRNLTAGGNTIYPKDYNDELSLASMVLSTTGIILSSTSLGLLFLTALLFKQWRNNYKNQLLIQFMLARFLFALARYSVDLGQFFSHREDVKPTKNYLHFILFVFIYTESALIIWMLVFTKQMYDSLVRVFYLQTSHRLVKTSLVAWLSPAAVYFVVLTALVLEHNHFMFVFLSYFFLFKWPVVFATGVLLVLVLRAVLRRRSKSGNVKVVIVMILMICMFCLQQILHDVFRIVYFYLTNVKHKNSRYFEAFSITFNIVTLYHCSVSILFWLFGNRETRDYWRFKKRIVSTLFTNLPDVPNIK